MKKLPSILLGLILVLILVIIYLLMYRHGKCEKETCTKETEHLRHEPKTIKLSNKGNKTLLFGISNGKSLIIKNRADSNSPWNIDSFPLASGVSLGFSAHLESLTIKDPDIPQTPAPCHYNIVGIDLGMISTSVQPTLKDGLKINKGMVNIPDLSGIGCPIVDDFTNDPGFEHPSYRVRGTASGCGVGFTPADPMGAYINYDFPLNTGPSDPCKDLYLQIDPKYPQVLLVGYPDPASGLIMSLSHK